MGWEWWAGFGPCSDSRLPYLRWPSGDSGALLIWREKRGTQVGHRNITATSPRGVPKGIQV